MLSWLQYLERIVWIFEIVRSFLARYSMWLETQNSVQSHREVQSVVIATQNVFPMCQDCTRVRTVLLYYAGFRCLYGGTFGNATNKKRKK